MSNQDYVRSLQNHYEEYMGIKGNKHTWSDDPHNKMHPEFFVLEFVPNKKHNMWMYCTVGMSLERTDDNPIELFIYSPKKDQSLVELMTLISSYHRNSAPLNIHHTFNIGRPWLDKSVCDYGFISLPYLDSESLELFNFNETVVHCYWVIPVTESEKTYKIEKGCDALEDLFEDKKINYLDLNRDSLI